MNNGPTSPVYLLNKLCLIGAFCWFFVQHDRLISSAERLQICRLIADRRSRRSADILQTFCIHSADDLHIVCRSAGTSVADLQQTINRSARSVRVSKDKSCQHYVDKAKQLWRCTLQQYKCTAASKASNFTYYIRLLINFESRDQEMTSYSLPVQNYLWLFAGGSFYRNYCISLTLFG